MTEDFCNAIKATDFEIRLCNDKLFAIYDKKGGCTIAEDVQTASEAIKEIIDYLESKGEVKSASDLQNRFDYAELDEAVKLENVADRFQNKDMTD